MVRLNDEREKGIPLDIPNLTNKTGMTANHYNFLYVVAMNYISLFLSDTTSQVYLTVSHCNYIPPIIYNIKENCLEAKADFELSEFNYNFMAFDAL